MLGSTMEPLFCAKQFLEKYMKYKKKKKLCTVFRDFRKAYDRVASAKKSFKVDINEKKDPKNAYNFDTEYVQKFKY